MLSLLLSLSVGFTMMGSPAQVPDDGDGGNSSAVVQPVTDGPLTPVHPGQGFFKKCKVKKIDASKLKSSKRVMNRSARLKISSLKKTAFFRELDITRIKDDPVPPPGNGRPNGGGGLGNGFRDKVINSTPTGHRN